MADQAVLHVIHGPNLDLLGERDPSVYGTETLADVEDIVTRRVEMLGLRATFFQSNHEGDVVEAVHMARHDADGLIINAGALTHYSRSLQDALAVLEIPIVEVHLSNVHAREPWRGESVVSPEATGTISGFGTMGYVFAADALAGLLREGWRQEEA